MGFLGKLFGKSDSVPEWAEFFSGEDFRIFMAAVRQDLANRGLEHAVDAAEGTVTVVQPGSGPQNLGLLNLAQVCHQIPRGEWPDVIRNHLDVVLKISADEGFMDQLSTGFAQARPLLKVRLYGDDYPVDRVPAVYRPVAEGLIATLVYDLPDSIATVPEDHLRKWGRSQDEIFNIALENVWAGSALHHNSVPLPQGGTLELLTGAEDYFAATHLLLLEKHLEQPAPLGVLAGVPNRHGVVFHPIRGMEVMSALQGLLGALPGMYAEGPGSITPNLYWWREGKLTLLPAAVESSEINFTPPDEFIEVLSQLAGGEE